MNAQGLLTQVLQKIGIEPGKDLIIRDDRFYATVLNKHSVGLGEAYMEGWWDTPDLTALFRKLIQGFPEARKYLHFNARIFAYYCMGAWLNRQHNRKALRDVQRHYDIGNELYEAMLDENMVYTCAYFKDPEWSLEKAQTEKIDLVFRKLHIPEKAAAGKPLKVLDIGCGWGYSLIHGARYYGVEGVGISLSKDQVSLARRKTANLPVDIRLQDYRDLPAGEQFDAIFSLGMFEHVGRKNYRKFMEAVRQHLAPDGLFLLHTIGGKEHGPSDPWINKYIFPGAYIPNIADIAAAADGLFIQHDFHNFGLYYARTANEWCARFEHNWERLRQLRPDFYDQRFFRIWKYYLKSSAASFYSGWNQVWQFVFSKEPLEEVYESVR